MGSFNNINAFAGPFANTNGDNSLFKSSIECFDSNSSNFFLYSNISSSNFFISSSLFISSFLTGSSF